MANKLNNISEINAINSLYILQNRNKYFDQNKYKCTYGITEWNNYPTDKLNKMFNINLPIKPEESLPHNLKDRLLGIKYKLFSGNIYINYPIKNKESTKLGDNMVMDYNVYELESDGNKQNLTAQINIKNIPGAYIRDKSHTENKEILIMSQLGCIFKSFDKKNNIAQYSGEPIT